MSDCDVEKMDSLQDMPDEFKPATVSESPGAAGYDIKHPNAMIVINNQAELNYICEWNEMHDILPPWLGKRSDYPSLRQAPMMGGGLTIWIGHYITYRLWSLLKRYHNV